MLRRALRQLAPPVLTSLLARRRTGGLYPSFAEAARACPRLYEDAELTRFRVERAKLNMADVSGARLPPGYALLVAATHMASSPAPLIVDFGGACGEWGHALAKDARRSFEYVVVETPALVERCTEDASFSRVRFAAEIPPTLDVFVSSGTLQFLADPYAPLEIAFSRARDAVVLARNCFSERKLFRVHRSRLGDNGSGARLPPSFDPEAQVSYPSQTVSYARVTELASAGGWRCLLCVDSASGAIPYRDEVFGRDLLFVRKGQEAHRGEAG